MSSIPASIPASEMEPGQLLNELEQRQDDVLDQLDALDAKLNEVLKGLGATMDDDEEVSDDDVIGGTRELPMAA